MHIVVTGGTGLVGSQVVRELAGRNVDVTVVTRDPSKATNLPPHVKATEGNLLQPATVRRVFNDADAVFLLNPVSQTEGHEALLALCGMRGARVQRLVYISVQHADRAAWLPHFGCKVGVEIAIQKSGIPFTILRPNNFFQNDTLYKDALLQWGVYPQPLGDVGTTRVDIRDIAAVAATALTEPGHEGQVYDVVGPEVLTGEACAKIWSEALGREIKYGGNDLDAWEEQSLKYRPDWAVYDFREMFAYFQKHGLIASQEAKDKMRTLLGRSPRSLEEFAVETAQEWKKSSAS